MERNNAPKIELTVYDDLFETDQSREEAALSKIRDIPLTEIDEFPDHPFKVLMDEDMEQLVDSIKRSGELPPAIVRLKEDGRYEFTAILSTNNANFESYIKVVKKDAETGKTIPYAGVGFQIYDPDGNLVSMTFTYPEVTTIDTFCTTADGELKITDMEMQVVYFRGCYDSVGYLKKAGILWRTDRRKAVLA